MEMKVVIIGASGLVGGNMLKYFSMQNWKVLGTHFSYPTKDTIPFDTLNPKNDQESYDLVKKFAPDWIVHCGALTWVDYCEEHPKESYEKTVVSTINMIELAKDLNAGFCYLSTDYVFDGKEGPYTESHEVNPLSVYGKHKLEAEQHVQNSGLNHLILRITNVYGDEERGKNFIARLLSLAKEGKTEHLKLPKDQYATPVNAKDVARATHVLISDQKDGIYHIASTDYMNRMQLAQRVLSNFPDANITMEALRTNQMNQAASRPLYGGLISKKFNREYPEFMFTNIDDYLKDKL